MYVREVGKLALYVRKKEWLMRLGSLGGMSKLISGNLRRKAEDSKGSAAGFCLFLI